MNLDWRLKPHEWLGMDALWCLETQQARRIWDEEHEAEKPAKK